MDEDIKIYVARWTFGVSYQLTVLRMPINNVAFLDPLMTKDSLVLFVSLGISHEYLV